jgi:uncharacterized protein YjdB
VASNGVYFTVSITVDPANFSVAAGNTALYTAIATYSDGSTQDVTAFASWSSSAPAIAVLDATGSATAIATGQAAVQAMFGGIGASATLTVTPGQLDADITPTYQPASAPL